MRAVLQRVTRARVLVDGDVAGEIGPGLVVLIAVGLEDTAATPSSMAEKIVNLRIFGDEQGNALYEEFVRALQALGVRVATGVFQTHMSVEIVNDGPVTILLDSDKLF